MIWSFIMPVSTQPRYHKRINAVSREGVSTYSLSFKRDYVPGPNGFKAEMLGEIEAGSYLRRLVPILRAVPKVRRKARQSEVLYAFGLDMLLLSWLSLIGMKHRPSLVYEVADIRDVFIENSLVGLVARSIEDFLLKKSELLVVTSEAYLSEYFRKNYRLDSTSTIVIENKVDEVRMDARPSESSYTKNHHDTCITIGYYGLIRCYRSCEVLAVSASMSDNIKVEVRGVGHGGVHGLSEFADSNSDIAYGGSYVNPDDLPEMYGSVDIVWACYPYGQRDTGNWRWARTNRFYESLFFGRPLIAQRGTEDAKSVERYEIGLVVDLGDRKFASQQISRISREDIKRWTQNLNRVPRSVYIYTDEHRRLVQAAKA